MAGAAAYFKYLQTHTFGLALAVSRQPKTTAVGPKDTLTAAVLAGALAEAVNGSLFGRFCAISPHADIGIG